GPHLTLASVSASATTSTDSGGAPMVSFGISLLGTELSLAAEVLAALIGNALAMPIDIELSADPQRGLSFRGGGVRATLPVNVSLPGIDLRAVNLSLTTANHGLNLGFGVTFTAGLPGLPLTFTVDGLGADFPVALGSAGLG